jgi:hypothetical protein
MPQNIVFGFNFNFRIGIAAIDKLTVALDVCQQIVGS